MKDGKYGIGLVMGVFDLFHIGHLNLIRNAKEHCTFLRVGVLSDALVEEYKGHTPVIGQAERMEIIRAMRYVDEVVLIDDNPSKLMEYDKRPFDCVFSGDDYKNHPYWQYEKEELAKRGADMYFFPYTKELNTTMIREKLRSEDPAGKTSEE